MLEKNYELLLSYTHLAKCLKGMANWVFTSDCLCKKKKNTFLIKEYFFLKYFSLLQSN